MVMTHTLIEHCRTGSQNVTVYIFGIGSKKIKKIILFNLRQIERNFNFIFSSCFSVSLKWINNALLKAWLIQKYTLNEELFI